MNLVVALRTAEAVDPVEIAASLKEVGEMPLCALFAIAMNGTNSPTLNI